jgi:hypothetical protein
MSSTALAIVDMAAKRVTSTIFVGPEDPEPSVDKRSVVHGEEFLHSEEFGKLVGVTSGARIERPSAASCIRFDTLARQIHAPMRHSNGSSSAVDTNQEISWLARGQNK